MKKRIIEIIIVLFAITLIIIGMVSVINSNKKHNSSDNKKTSEKKEKTSTKDNKYFSSSDEVLAEIRKTDSTVAYAKEEDGCWYFVGGNNTEYRYCSGDTEILTIATESTSVDINN